MITEDYVSFETAKLLKENGFDEPCYCLWNNPSNGNSYNSVCEGIMTYKDIDPEVVYHWYLCPTLQMAMKWLREVHKIGVFPTTFYRHTETFDGHDYGCTLVNLKTFDVIGNFEDCTFPADSYEQACEAAIKYCLENLI